MRPFTDTHSAVFEQLRPRLRAISSRIVGNTADAEEIVQDCFLSWRDADRAGLVTPAAWLTTVVQRRSIDCLRRRARDEVAAHGSEEWALAAQAPSPEEQLLRRAHVGEALACLLAGLSRSERITLVLHEVLECEHAEIAAALATSAANARQLLRRARRRLEEAAGEPPPGEKLCRELVRDFQAAINGLDRQAVVTLLGDAQPVSVQAAPRWRACANDACYAMRAAA